MEFFAAGKDHRERLMLAANRVGKTEGVGGYECVLHALGTYPKWWDGRRFDHPTKIWMCGESSNTVREILQEKTLGPVGNFGTGLIPKSAIIRTTNKRNVSDAIHDVYVRHVTGGESHITYKSYEMGREAYQGSEVDVILLDEEPDEKIYTEALLRTMTTNGLILCTFTPLKGLSDVVLGFLPGGKMPHQDPIRTP